MCNEKINILIVDDRPENLLALEAILDEEEYNLIKAFSGEEALRFLLQYDFAAILLDVQMPGMDGFTTAKFIRAREKTKNIPILFITANYMDSEHIFMGYSVGAIDYILKPFDPIILKSKVERFVELYLLRQKLIIQSNKLEEKNKVIEYMAYHDGLTDLPNRRKFNEELIRFVNIAKSTNESLGLMYLDLDRFKYINDSLGHSMGDKLLQHLAKRLSMTIRDSDFVARMGGDEFVVLLPNSNREQCLEVTENILDAFKNPFTIHSYEFHLTACIGLAIFPFDGEDANTLLKNADAALYRAKEQGKNKFSVYHSGMNLQSYRTFLMQNDLRNAIENEEFTLVYQPRIQLSSEQVVSAEAFIRWNHPKWGTISPNEFIPIAEESELIFEIDKWVLQTVCKQINSWDHLGFSPTRIAINFSAKHFLQQNFIEQIKKILHDSKIDPKRIEIEITETALLKNEDIVKHTLKQLKDMDIHVSLDDFGTGYSSMNYLRDFHFDTVKIDQSYIQDITLTQTNSHSIVESMISLGKKLNINVVAEGVETTEQLQRLLELQCDDVQGYIYSYPLSPQHFLHYLNSRNSNNTTTNITKTLSDKVIVLNPKEGIGINRKIIESTVQQFKFDFALSNRELDVFSLIVEGSSNKVISEKLFISEHTVKNHITNILSKLRVSDRVHAIALVYEQCINKKNVQ
ncbi:EAL domain-containing protein [Lysinibacillus sp. BW-2-10]|uniref:EAL domain-containing protein n=1 Tax=Lysinibacillus sp. BW-2-10 TaxID=2590030 RepID=UPI00164237C6|nr:EAL domain-containing protein [Lysinibacillus sp. BW-2-10]